MNRTDAAAGNLLIDGESELEATEGFASGRASGLADIASLIRTASVTPLKIKESDQIQKERAMLVKVRQLLPDQLAELEEFLDELLARKKHREFLEQAYELTAPSLARHWGPPDEEPPKAKP
jgi:hypothetical protein